MSGTKFPYSTMQLKKRPKTGTLSTIGPVFFLQVNSVYSMIEMETNETSFKFFGKLKIGPNFLFYICIYSYSVSFTNS